jgi:hypothetical protein
MSDRLTETARSLADALSDFARSRKDDDKKRVAELQTDLCRARHEELQREDQNGS